jgi:DNA mismatch endonuclease (patch repair protein)
MQANRGADTSPEMLLRRGLHALGFRYSLSSRLPGRPDIVFPSRGVALFVDGCFWHRCPEHFVMPATNRSKWLEKLEKIVPRDRRVDQELGALGWTVVRVWEHEIRRTLDETLKRVCSLLRSKEASIE